MWKCIADYLLMEGTERFVIEGSRGFWLYALDKNLSTTFGWSTPDAPGGSLAPLWMLFPLNGFNPFTFNTYEINITTESVQAGENFVFSYMNQDSWRLTDSLSSPIQASLGDFLGSYTPQVSSSTTQTSSLKTSLPISQSA